MCNQIHKARFYKCIYVFFFFSFAGVVVFTDVILPRRISLCNQTLGYAECLSGRCYLANRKCDGHFDCDDGTDEALCNFI